VDVTSRAAVSVRLLVRVYIARVTRRTVNWCQRHCLYEAHRSTHTHTVVTVYEIFVSFFSPNCEQWFCL